MFKVIRLLLALVLIGYVIWKFFPIGVDSRYLEQLLLASLAVQPLVLISLVLQSSRLGMMAGLPARKIRRPLAAFVLSQGLNLILPGRVSEAFKATYLRAYAFVPLSKGMAAVFLERSVDTLIVAALGLVGIALLSLGSNLMAFAIAGAVTTFLICVPLLESQLLSLAGMIPWERVRNFLEIFFQHVAEIIRGGDFYRALVLGVATWAISFANIYLFVIMAGARPVDIAGVLLLFVATTVGGAIPALPGGFGGYEAAAVFALKSYGYNVEEALSLAIVMHLAQFVIPVIGASLVFSRERTGVSALVKRIMTKTSG